MHADQLNGSVGWLDGVGIGRSIESIAEHDFGSEVYRHVETRRIYVGDSRPRLPPPFVLRLSKVLAYRFP